MVADSAAVGRTPLRIRAIACEVLARQVYLAAARSPQVVDVELLEKGLHDSADTLRAELQRRVDAVTPDRYDATVLVYGLCNRATEGIVARHVPLALARAHDCITLYLGSRERYAAEFDATPGTYYYSAEWIERGPSGSLQAAGAPSASAADAGMAYGSRLPSNYVDLVQKYGEDNAKYLLEVYGGWQQHYTRTAFIALPCSRCEVAECAHDAPFRQRAQAAATRHEWQYVELQGDPTLVRQLIDGEWWPTGQQPAGEDILVVPTGGSIVATYDERVIAAS